MPKYRVGYYIETRYSIDLEAPNEAAVPEILEGLVVNDQFGEMHDDHLDLDDLDIEEVEDEAVGS